jgi:ATP-dependent helicase/nuclease subunit A
MMTMSDAFNIPPTTLAEQFAASDPERSAWVSANAGSGKTHVLTQRVIRLMLAGNSPDRILCLTFTKAAAANMKNRVFDTLGGWTMLPDDKLAVEIEKSTGKRPTHKTLNRARQLFTEALDTPGGLKIQTIHAFCEALLHQFPLEANVSGHFEVVQDVAQTVMLAEARASILQNDAPEELLHAFEALAELVSDYDIDNGIAELISKRHAFQAWMGRFETIYAQLGISPDDTVESIISDAIQQIGEHADLFREVVPFASASDKKTDITLAKNLTRYLNSDCDSLKFEAIKAASLTQAETVRTDKGLAAKEVKKTFPDLVERIQVCGEIVLNALDTIRTHRMIEKSRYLFTIARAVLDGYEREKRAKGLVDYDDMIWKCEHLLKRPDIRDWVRYRLDQGIDHMLVDEAQDTSPAQWQIINAVTEDFYTGEGAFKRNRTIFVVGDEKQSIYSFQGADPAEFYVQQNRLETKVSDVGRELKNAKLNLSFRSTQDVLHAVDEVFKLEVNAQGLTQDGGTPTHDAVRNADPGEVQVWPLFIKEKTTEPQNWLDPIDRDGAGDPAVLLAEKITQSVKSWVGQVLPGMQEPLTHGDILVLVRKRDRFIPALTRTMKDAGVKVAGSDRLRLLEHIAIEDLLAIGRFTLLPDDDLNLACVLKSVLFDMDDETLFSLAHKRGKKSLIQHLESIAADDDHAANEIAKQVLPVLELIQNKSTKLGLYEFYAWVLGVHGLRRKILARLGMEAEDVLDAFVDEILSFTQEGGLGLEAFIAQLTKANPEIKREVELDRDEVRIMTVHASKGLEARVVFMVDSCGKAIVSSHRSKLIELETGSTPALVWAPSGVDQVSGISETLAAMDEATESEYRRLLYVGMTRAADRLVVCGYRGINEPKYSYWHKMVHDALAPDAAPILDDDGEQSGIRWISEDKPARDAKAQNASSPAHLTTAPDWLFTPAPSEPVLPRPLTPSGAYAIIDEELKERRRPPFEPVTEASGFSLEIGNTVHTLLELLPDVSADRYQEIIDRYVRSVGSAWSANQRNSVFEAVEAILSGEEFQPIFSKDSRAEVSLVGSLETQSGLRLISGQIDRLVVEENRLMVVDYKTNRIVPDTFDEYPSEYVAQLALYRHLVREIFPKHSIACAILWTSHPKLIELPDELLDCAMAVLKKG